MFLFLVIIDSLFWLLGFALVGVAVYLKVTSAMEIGGFVVGAAVVFVIAYFGMCLSHDTWQEDRRTKR